jgi:hypothetical protein
MSTSSVDIPTMTDNNGNKLWRLNGKIHREDGPALEYPLDGRKEWYSHGLLHREDGPAITCAYGYNVWYLNGKRHREDGPALEYQGAKVWYLNGNKITEEEHSSQTSLVKRAI